MASPLVIPGVQVRTAFEPAAPIPSATGIVGVVGVADRGPLEPTPIGSMSELAAIFGLATRFTMPEVRIALAEGVSQAVIARTAPGRGQKARLDLQDDEGEAVVLLVARAEGEWGNRLAVQTTQVKTLSGLGVKYVNLDVFLDGRKIESFGNLVMDETSPNYLFDRINEGSAVLVAVDPLFESGLPRAIANAALADEEARAAFALLRAGATDVLRAEARQSGRSGNLIALQVRDGRAGLRLLGVDNADSVDLRAREPGAAGTEIRASVVAAGEAAVSIVISPQGEQARTLGPFASVDEIVAGLAADPAVEARALGGALPAVLNPTALRRRIDLDVLREGQDKVTYRDLVSLAQIAALEDPNVAFSAVGAATQLPDANEGVPLSGGRERGPALALPAESNAPPLLEFIPAGGQTNLRLTTTIGTSTRDGATTVANLRISQDDTELERFADLTMDPDDERYLPAVLEAESQLIRARDLFVRSRTTSLPRNLVRPSPLTGGESPLPEDFQAALDRLEAAEEVDLVIAAVANQLDDADVITVQKAVIGHCAKMAEVARNRIGLGSALASASDQPAAILDHADDVRSDHFILCAPAGAEAGVAGLLGRQDYFQSPTFKTVANLGVPPGTYSDAQLTQLIRGNVLTVSKRRGRGVIVVKGTLTSGRQINVQRTANKAVRDVKAIADNYVGQLNNEGARNALKQQITGLFLQMERDGAIVPSTDGSDPAFKVHVYASQFDFSAGIVRVDIAIRPVRAIDFVYATILVQN